MYKQIKLPIRYVVSFLFENSMLSFLFHALKIGGYNAKKRELITQQNS